MGHIGMARSFEPLSETELSQLLKCSNENHGWRVVSHESSSKEFKASFHFNSLPLYARTMAGFANASGGYIIFGIEDNPRTLKGLADDIAASFDNLDAARLTELLNDLFVPEIHWERTLTAQYGRAIGVIYVHKALRKPIMARKSQNKAQISEGDIFYRYNGRTEKIKFPELSRIIDEARDRERRALQLLVDRLVSSGPSNVAILDFATSQVTGYSGQSLLIDEALIPKLTFIREGEFNDIAGAPTLKLVGDVKPFTSLAVTTSGDVHKVAISTEDAFREFLRQSKVESPLEYIKQICIGSTCNVPIHFYRSCAGITVAEVIDYIGNLGTRSINRNRVLRRLIDNTSYHSQAPSPFGPHPSTLKRYEWYVRLMNGECEEATIGSGEVQHLLKAMSALPLAEVRSKKDFLLRLLGTLFESVYNTSDSSVADAFRRACCWVDQALYGE